MKWEALIKAAQERNKVDSLLQEYKQNYWHSQVISPNTEWLGDSSLLPFKRPSPEQIFTDPASSQLDWNTVPASTVSSAEAS